MYINAKKRVNRKDITVFYLYVSESYRVDGEVKNTQKYFGSIDEVSIIDDDWSRLSDAFQGDWTEEELQEVESKLYELKKELLNGGLEK